MWIPTIPTITETNLLIYTMVDHGSDHWNAWLHQEQYPPWRKRLGTEGNQLLELQKCLMRNLMPKIYSKLPNPEALETAKQIRTAIWRNRSQENKSESSSLVPARSGRGTRCEQPHQGWRKKKQCWKSIWETWTGFSTHQSSRHPGKSLKHEWQDSTTAWHESHLLAKEVNCTPWASGSTNDSAGSQ